MQGPRLDLLRLPVQALLLTASSGHPHILAGPAMRAEFYGYLVTFFFVNRLFSMLNTLNNRRGRRPCPAPLARS